MSHKLLTQDVPMQAVMQEITISPDPQIIIINRLINERYAQWAFKVDRTGVTVFNELNVKPIKRILANNGFKKIQVRLNKIC